MANHQIRSLRPLLIQDTVDFQQNYFLRKIASGYPIGTAKFWYAHAREDQSIDRDSDGDGQIAMFFEALFKLLLSFDPPKRFPSTFTIDIDRLLHLRSDVRDAINLKACDKLFSILLSRNGYTEGPTSEMLNSVRSCCLSILEEFEGEARWAEHAKSVALEITRSAHNIYGKKDFSADLDYAEVFLAEVIGRDSGRWSHMRKSTEIEIWPPLIDSVKCYRHLSPLDIWNQVEAHTRPALRRRSHDPVYLAKRIAHIGILHWQVWAPILYLRHDAVRPAILHEERSDPVSEDCSNDTDLKSKP